MTTPKHSPLPWEADAIRYPEKWIIVTVAGGGTVAFALHKDDADHIVRAVNAHEELVKAAKALENLMRLYDSFEKWSYTAPEGTHKKWDAATRAARKAVAQTKRRTS